MPPAVDAAMPLHTPLSIYADIDAIITPLTLTALRQLPYAIFADYVITPYFAIYAIFAMMFYCCYDAMPPLRCHVFAVYGCCHAAITLELAIR